MRGIWGEGLSMSTRVRNERRHSGGIGGARRSGTILAAAFATLSLTACGADLSDFSTASIATYQPASFFSPNGYAVTANADGSLRVTASGPPGTPASRLEKIALARAAEYGEEQHAKTFRASAPQTSMTCGRTKISTKTEQINVRPLDYRTVAIDVTYGSDPSDPAARPIHGTAAALKAEIASESVPPDVQAAATQEVAEHCGR
jgi:hypothetical protein